MANLSKELVQYLRLCGYSDNQIAGYTYYTQLYHEMGVYGDMAYDHIIILEESFGVDLSSFVFEDYFPDEFPGRNRVQKCFFWFFSWLIPKAAIRKQYKPITLQMIGQAIMKKNG